jgi:hypothetical protein
MIQDAYLKNQALVFASTSHEINLLHESNAESAKHLTAIWTESIKEFIPDVSYERIITTSQDHMITLFWPSAQGFSDCTLAKHVETDIDCLHL